MENMQMTPVQSSTIQAIGHDAARSALRVQFASGGTYEYAGVSAELFERFQASESKGRFFHSEIKPKFSTTKVSAQEAQAEPESEAQPEDAAVHSGN